MVARQLLATVLAVVAGFAALLGVAAWYASHEVVDRAAFADRALVALDEDAVHRAVRDELTAQVLAVVPDVPVVRRQVEQTIDTVIDTPDFRRTFRRGAADVNRVLFSSERADAALQIDVSGALGDVDPRLADVLPASLDAQLLELRTQSLGVGTRRGADAVDAGAVVLPIVAVVALALALLVAADRRRALRSAAIAAILTGALLLVVSALGRSAALDRVQAGGSLSREQTRAAADAAVAVYADDLRTRLLIATGAGVLVLLVTLVPLGGGGAPSRRRASV